jgi:hypothetical protein
VISEKVKITPVIKWKWSRGEHHAKDHGK